MSIRILAIGKKHEAWTQVGVERYEKRLRQPFNISWVLLSHSAKNGTSARQDESERLLDRLSSKEYVILLDERGKMVDSPALPSLLLAPIEQSKDVTIIIGGAYGVNESLYQRANMVWSLSPLVFPHQLVRLILVEQLYRAQEISSGGPYHHV
jgi:23S rRNA (pseudouridine1915-N3)-methyltransferase